MKAKLLAILLVAALVPGIAAADTQNTALGKVWIDVAPNVGVGFVSGSDMGSIQTGKFSRDLIFQVDANTEAVKICVLVSNLYKGNDPENDEVDPIPADASVPVGVEPALGNRIEGLGNALAVVGAGTIMGAEGEFPAVATECGIFESSQDGHFSQTVTVTPTWNQNDPEKPMGEYSGYVQLNVQIVLPGGGTTSGV